MSCAVSMIHAGSPRIQLLRPVYRYALQTQSPPTQV